MPLIGTPYGGPQSLSDVLAIIGAGLKDASPGSNGNALQQVQQLLIGRQTQARQLQFLSQLSGAMNGTPGAPAQYQDGPAPSITPPPLPGATAGPSAPTGGGLDDTSGAMALAQKALAPGPVGQSAPYQYQAPQMTAPATPGTPGLSLNSPELPKLALMGELNGIPLTSMIDAMKAQRPEMMVGPDGVTFNKFDASQAGKVHPSLDKGQVPLFDAQGNFSGVKNADGSVQAAAQMAGAVSNAQESAKAGFNLVDVPIGGQIVKMPASIAAPLLARAAAARFGGGAPGAAGAGPAAGGPDAGQFGVAPSPAETELAKARAGTQGKNEADIAGAKSAMQQVDDQTNMIAQNLHDMLGETQDPNTGKWVKTKPSMIHGGMVPSAGSATDLVEHVPFINQPAKDLGAKMETVRNGTSFNSLQAIKGAMAAAGDGGSGSIRMTDQTARMLGEINGSLNQDQSPAQLEATVRRHLTQLDQLSKDRHALFDSQYQGVRQATPGQTGPTANYAPAPRAPVVSGKGYTITAVRRAGQ